MANYQNHVIDPTFFYSAIEEFAFDYDMYVLSSETDVDDYGNPKLGYSKQTIRGSLQTDGTKLSRKKTGNTNDVTYNFYCKSLYRIDIGDVIDYKGNYLMVDGVHEYDEWGVRQCSLHMIQLTAYRDLAAYIKFINGDEFV